MNAKKSLLNVLFWISLALIFNAGIFFFLGEQKALEFFGGYIIEQSLSLDNLFLFLIIFNAFKINIRYQRRVLSYGIIGAIIFRLIFIILGVVIVNSIHWILYLFGVILIFSGMKVLSNKEEKNRNFKDSVIIKTLNKFIPISDKLDGERFFTRRNNIFSLTPLFATLIVIETSDIIFAIDSIPAIFSITTDPFIVYSSNIFAILGLRSMYFILEKLCSKFKYIKFGVALILIFAGIKLSILFFHVEIPIILSVMIIIAILLLSILVSIIFENK